MLYLIDYYILIFASSSVIIVLGALLMGIRISEDKHMQKLRNAKKYLSLSYIILGVSGYISFFLREESENQLLLVTSTLFVASYQALLFTMTLLVFIQPDYVSQEKVLKHFSIITVTGIGLFIALNLCSQQLFSIFLYIAIVAYLLQLGYYIWLFNRQYKACLNLLELYYDENENARLKWVKHSFYSALGIGILALVAVHCGIRLYSVFIVIYTGYYAYVVCRFYNYQPDIVFIIPAVTKLPRKKENTGASCDNQSQSQEEMLNFRKAIEKWIKEKKYLEKDISVDEIAESLGVSHSFLQYYFRSYMPTDFRTWRSELRINEAQRILKENPQISLEAVRELVGFNHRANFHQQFQKITGMTPTEYRQKCGRNV